MHYQPGRSVGSGRRDEQTSALRERERAREFDRKMRQATMAAEYDSDGGASVQAKDRAQHRLCCRRRRSGEYTN